MQTLSVLQLCRTALTVISIIISTFLPAVGQSWASGPTNAGTDFCFSLPANFEDPGITQQYIRLYIASGTVTDVRIWTGPVLKEVVKTKLNGIVTVDLTKQEAQAVSRANDSPIPDDQVYTNKAVRIESDAPIVVYGMNRTSFTSDGLLILPTNALGKDYVIASATDAITGVQGYRLPSQFVITAPYDATEVSILLPMDSPNHNAGEIFTISMNRGDVYSSMSVNVGGDLSGAYILASNPIAVTAGESCTFLPNPQYQACDHLVEMLIPVSSWGKFYHAVTYQGRLKGDMFRIYAGEPDADIVINGVLYGTLPQAGGTNGSGWLEFLPPDPGVYEFASSKPIFVAQYNNSQEYDNVQTDPFYSILTPVEQYQKEFIFSTPGNDFPQNFINLVCDSSAFQFVEIAHAGTDNWEYVWKKYGADVKSFPTLIDGKRYIGKRFEITPGAYRMRGTEPMAGYIYGSGPFDSYGYPLALVTSDINSADNESPLIISEFGNDGVVTGSVVDFPEDEEMRSNLSTVRLDPAGSYNYTLSYEGFGPRKDRSVDYTLLPINPAEDARAIMVVCDMAGNCATDTLEYVAQVSSTGSNHALVNTTTLRVVPNPGTGAAVTIAVPVVSTTRLTIMLYDASGKAVYTVCENILVEQGEYVAQLETEGIAPGAYFIRATLGTRTPATPLIIAR